ncbi:uncharacterized protein LOC106778740 [Vigna radiata var. radiata]|uniref:Uncharacterized protein LOC106778740 n=1 Tax=Vigna radiata var. radiata TaxID=3916 RepID=A0A1S3VUZ7_VIGRR|nr:uncharacterized protein LOC106778740 [Vigna radiata var. radiata]
MAFVSHSKKAYDFRIDIISAPCNLKLKSVSDGFFENFETGNLECKITSYEESCSKMQKTILLSSKFTKFLKKTNNQDHSVDAKNKEELIMMAKSRVVKPDLEQHFRSPTWYLDNECSRHMTEDPKKFSEISYKVVDHVTYAKNDALKFFKRFTTATQNEMDLKIKAIKSDHGGEFQNKNFDEYLAEMGITHNFSAPRTPQQNGVVERKNRVLEELARSMLNDRDIPKYFWADAIYAEENQNTMNEEVPEEATEKEDEAEQVESPKAESIKTWKVPRNVSTENVIGDMSRGVSTRRQLNQYCMNVAFVSKIEPKKVKEALSDENWMIAMQEELNQFTRNNVWELVPRKPDL